MTWLVTGGAGYIGAHTVRRLSDAGHRVVVLDDLSTGLAARLPSGVPLIVGSMRDSALVASALSEYQVDGVVHLAARKSAVESVEQPQRYHEANVGGLASVLDAMAATGVKRIVFASSAAVYGSPTVPLVTETTATEALNPYGRTKMDGERLLVDRGGDLSWIVLRYFNAAGTDDPALVDHGRTNLLPHVFQALAQGTPVMVNGDDYTTRDGTGVRDYVHPADLASANLAAVSRLMAGPTTGVYNVGGGRGHSVLEVLAAIEAVSGRPVPYVVGARRPGDPAEVVASVAKIRSELDWAPEHGLDSIIASEWQARLADLTAAGLPPARLHQELRR
ncbi:UDP-glucose 4-epimerase GalE [Solihabitans fulvus]|uniref:UDP-glucose 4-epimerase n=1 Tax=Solihabitans fulvus TaxID=1892852 RepID=A0A5B2WUT0_9PSEU|nr:UDP-glucose 4-epimerase GalE [Solihabitans fulvus]KAA2255481.1 UDP-glucose 4-epimerase GalE [Solihabitans fulvus]